MAKEPNRLLRVLVPLLVVFVGGVGIFFAVMKNTGAGTNPQPAAPTAAAPAGGQTPSQAAPAAATQASPTPANPAVPAASPSAPAAADAGAKTPTPVAGETYSAKTFPVRAYDPVGSATPKDKGGQYEMEIQFSPLGSGIEALKLANHFVDWKKTEPEVLQSFRHPRVGFDGDGKPIVNADPRAGLDAFAAYTLYINEQAVRLWKTTDAAMSYWQQVEGKPGEFRAVVVNQAGEEVARVTRAFELKPGTFDLTLRQTVENLRSTPIAIRWEQFGPVSPPVGTMRYGGDTRRVRFGFMLPDEAERNVYADDRAASLILHPTAVGNKDGDIKGKQPPEWISSQLWPSKDSEKQRLTLSFAGITNRYFTVAMYPARDASGAAPKERAFGLASSVWRVAVPSAEPDAAKTFAEIALFVSSPSYTVAGGGTQDLSMGLYAGPSSKPIIEKNAPVSWSMGIAQSVMYTLGGPCSFCTFQWLTTPLHWLLTTLHDFVTQDWALAIMLLVVCVRTVLHPVTRWTQRKMYFFSKEMAKIAPKMKAIQDRYKDDPAKLREEQTRMMGEHGGVYASGALGCLPAFLQTPVWIALSAMISFAFELRHTPGFFGIFQKMAPGWSFLADLSSPDHLISFGTSFNVPLLSMLLGPIDGLNVLPLLLGVVFFIQQKYLQPPQTTPLTPEQEQQQKMMKVMTVVMFPLMMYNAPAGLALYFATNSSLAIIESKLIRAKAEEEWKEMEAVKAAKIAARASGVGAGMFDRKDAKPAGGIFDRLRKAVEQAQKARDEAQKKSNKKYK